MSSKTMILYGAESCMISWCKMLRGDEVIKIVQYIYGVFIVK